MADRRLGYGAALTALVILGGCATRIHSTPGIDLFMSKADDSAARRILLEEVLGGRLEAKFALGQMILDGRGGFKDVQMGEQLLIESSLMGDPRAFKLLAQFYRQRAACDADKVLADEWPQIGFLQRNLVYGYVEVRNSDPSRLLALAKAYRKPCPGKQPRFDTAANLELWASDPRPTGRSSQPDQPPRA